MKYTAAGVSVTPSSGLAVTHTKGSPPQGQRQQGTLGDHKARGAERYVGAVVCTRVDALQGRNCRASTTTNH